MNQTGKNDYDKLQTEEDKCDKCNRAVSNDEYTVNCCVDCYEMRPTRCRGDDGEVIICSECGKLEPVEYMYRDKSSTLCNACSYPYNWEQSLQLNYRECSCCRKMDELLMEEPYELEKDLLKQYHVEKQNDLLEYAKTYELTVAEAIDYQTHCHACGEDVEGDFSGVAHSYCKKYCFESCEIYYLPCFRKGDCKVCNNWYENAQNK
jgi:hypothetical protein